MQQETRAADVRVNRMQLLIDSRNMWLRWHMFPGSTLKRPTNWIRHLKPEPYSQNLISRFWQWEGGAGVADESDDTDESGTASALINMVSFAVVDITEYLDTHPIDAEAICYFNHHIEMRRNAMQVYADKFGPLTIDTANPDAYWDWAKQPLPWEGGGC